MPLWRERAISSDFYTVEEAAGVLQLTPGRIRQMLRAGDLEGVAPEESGLCGAGGYLCTPFMTFVSGRPA